MTWRPLPGDDPPPAKGIASSLSRITARLGMANPKQSEAVFSQWDEVVGPQLAGKCQPVNLVDEVLVVEAADSRWATQLKWLAPQLVDKVNDKAGTAAVKRIEVRISGSKPRK